MYSQLFTSMSTSTAALVGPLTHFHHRFALPVPPLPRGPAVDVAVMEKAFLTGWQSPFAGAKLDLTHAMTAANAGAMTWLPLVLTTGDQAAAGPTPAVLVGTRFIPHLEAKLRVTVMQASSLKPSTKVRHCFLCPHSPLFPAWYPVIASYLLMT
jgi:hypothetical protein